MKPSNKVKGELDKKFQAVLKTPASFDFFVAIHDFIGYIEANSILANSLSPKLKPNRQQNISVKYNNLKQIYQGLEDAQGKANVDLGHARCMILVELNRIKANVVSDSNSFWKKRDLYRKLTEEIYGRLSSPRVA